MHLPTAFILLLTASQVEASIVVIDDFSSAQPLLTSSAQNISPEETSSPSIFGGFRRILANGYRPFTVVDGKFTQGDTAGTSSIEFVDGRMNLSKTALTGSAFASYSGRKFTPGDRIGDLSMDISGGPGSLASAILLITHSPLHKDQTLSLSLTSAIGTSSAFDIVLAAGSTTTIDLTTAQTVWTGALGSVDFSNVEEILLGITNGDPAGSVSITEFAFIPEPSPLLLAAFSIAALGACRRRPRHPNHNQRQSALANQPANLTLPLRGG